MLWTKCLLLVNQNVVLRRRRLHALRKHCDTHELAVVHEDVVDGKVVAAMKRTGAEGDFRSNLHRGGTAQVVRITKVERDTALRAARAFGLGTAGVDLLRSDSGPKVLEVNSSPGFEGIEKATGKDIVGMVYDMIEARVKPQPVRKRKA